MEIITILIGGIAGFLIGQANGYFERRSAKKIALSKALSELLEIRHRFKGSMYVFKRFMNETDLSAANYNQIITALPEGFLWDKKISDRYNEALNLLSAHLPILSFMLRSKDIAGLLGSGALLNVEDSKESRTYMVSLLEKAENSISSELERSIENIANLIGKKHKVWVSQYIAESQEPSAEAQSLLDFSITSIQSAISHVAPEN